MLKSEDTEKKVYEKLWETILCGKSFETTLKNIDKNGKQYWLQKKISPNFDFNNKIIGFTEISLDDIQKETQNDFI